MKKFLSGFLAGILLVGVSISALAITGNMTIDVYPINIQVNGETFQPTDVNGKEVPVFAYQGTTYAPLRALAEAYGLEVGYDAGANMATVKDPDTPMPNKTTAYASSTFSWSENDEEAYEQFKALWNIIPYESVGLGQTIYSGRYNGELEYEDVITLLEGLNEDLLDSFAIRLADEVAEEHDMVYNHFLLSFQGKRIYSIVTENGKSTLHERIGLFQ